MALKAFLVEDQPAIRDSLVEALREITGIEPAGWAASEKAAKAWLHDPGHHWDIAIVDLVLEPGGSGFGVLQALRDRLPTQKVVVLTATANPQVRRHCEAMGADGVFDKGMETEALLDYCVKLARAAGGH
ncbi:response regulator transcription factor [Ramlibacter sp. USB13]|uniref:Response regulator transcription factor n=1 Tax=Ramlibacter cellulosilyticus TaxID=2764187 RepID=A0A923MUK4_9BURK|nr:response regulator [Ramlibacter cellulosilyticus]MBC5784919.1 response regulator transcription factor [Ramlibacter cellulosilyticus]